MVTVANIPARSTAACVEDRRGTPARAASRDRRWPPRRPPARRTGCGSDGERQRGRGALADERQLALEHVGHDPHRGGFAQREEGRAAGLDRAAQRRVRASTMPSMGARTTTPAALPPPSVPSDERSPASSARVSATRASATARSAGTPTPRATICRCRAASASAARSITRCGRPRRGATLRPGSRW